MNQQSSVHNRWLWAVGTIAACFTVLIALILLSSSSGFYGPEDYFGPFTKYGLYFVLGSVLVGTLCAIAWQDKGKYVIILLAPIVVLVLFKYVIPQYIDSQYATSFNDAPGHLTRGLYVAVTGHSNPSVDSYFDLQPGFFWETAIIFNVLSGTPTSLTSPLSLLVLKWFPFLIILIYVPILWTLYKELIGKRVLISAAIVSQLALDTAPFHYAAQTYGDVMFWFALTLIFIAWNHGAPKYLGLVLLTAVSLIFVHAGITFMMLLILVSLGLYQVLFRSHHRPSWSLRRGYFILLLSFTAIWMGYLSFWTFFTFKNFIGTFRSVLDSLLTQNVALVSSGLSRSNDVWASVVSEKALFFLVVLASGLLASLWNAYRGKDDRDRLVLCMLIIGDAVFGSTAVALGAAGYIERLPEMTLPLIVYSVIKFATNLKIRNHTFMTKGAPFLLVALVSVSAIAGTAFYFSGSNFQSLTYGEIYSDSFLTNNTQQNIAGLYANSPRTTLFLLEQSALAGHSSSSNLIISATRSDYIEIDYYLTGNMGSVQSFVGSLSNSKDIVYTNPDASLLVSV